MLGAGRKPSSRWAKACASVVFPAPAGPVNSTTIGLLVPDAIPCIVRAPSIRGILSPTALAPGVDRRQQPGHACLANPIAIFRGNALGRRPHLHPACVSRQFRDQPGTPRAHREAGCVGRVVSLPSTRKRPACCGALLTESG